MHFKYFFKEKSSIFLSVIFSFFIMESFIFFGVEYVKKNDLNFYLNAISPDFKSHIDIANSHLTDISKIFYDTQINTSSVIEIIDHANNTNDLQKQSQLRNELLTTLRVSYKYMKKYRIRQLHFQLPNAVSFLRFHRPNKYGDSLLNIRETLKYVNNTKQPISAFEEGRIFNGFRNVYPLYKNKKFIGTVEISFSFKGMQELLSKIDNTSYLFIIQNNVVNKKVFKDEKSNYTFSEFSNFNYDTKTLKDNMQISLKDMHTINQFIANQVQKRLKDGKLFSLYFKDPSIQNNHSIIISFNPIFNLNNKLVAYIIHYEFGDFIDILLKNLTVVFTVLTFSALLLSSVLTFILLNERKKRMVIYNLAVRDALTNIYNRHGINEILNQKLAEYRRNKKHFSVIFFDIDFFKKVNDTYGHDIGDYVLVDIAKLVSAEIRASDIFARWGGEEFIVFLPDTDLKEATIVAEKLRITIKEHSWKDVNSITCSFGVTSLQDDDNRTKFLKRVDKLLYNAKDNGRNCVINDI